MSVQASDIVAYLSGGSTNTDPDASLGGAISSTAINDNTLENLFDNVTGDEHSAGDTEYRCFYIKNDNGTSDQAYDTKLWIESNTTGADSDVSIGLDGAGIDGTAETIADEDTAPTSPTFSQPTSTSPITIGDLPAGSYIAVWVKRVITSGTTPEENDTFELKIQAETL